MDHKLLLAKCVTLLYKESQLKDTLNNSRALVEEAIKEIQPRDINLGLNMDKDVVRALKDTVIDMLATPHDQGADKAGLLQRIRIDVGDNDKLYQAVEKGLVEITDVDELTKSIKNTRRPLEQYLKDLKVSKALTQASSTWNYNRDKIKDANEFLTQLWSQLEPLSSLKTKDDPAIIDEIRLGDTDAVNKVVSKIHVSAVESRIYKTGWQGLNRMLQGGFRPGEMWVPAALPHKYKTGFTQSVFNQIALYNKPMLNNPGKKSAGVCIAFEDTSDERFQFIFKQLMSTERNELVDVTHYKIEEIQGIIVEKLSINGFEMFFYRVDPTRWTYYDLFNLITTIELKGYDIEFCLIDRLEMLPTTGCIQSGPMGSAMLDLYTRVRIFFNTKGIFHITPHQLSTEAKQLIRGTVTDAKFVQALVGRGYYQGAKGLDQIPDGILLNHIFKHGEEWYLAIQRDRHRLSSIVEEKFKHMYLKFPAGMPIPDDLHSDDSTLYKLPAYRGNADESMFNFE